MLASFPGPVQLSLLVVWKRGRGPGVSSHLSDRKDGRKGVKLVVDDCHTHSVKQDIELNNIQYVALHSENIFAICRLHHAYSRKTPSSLPLLLAASDRKLGDNWE